MEIDATVNRGNLEVGEEIRPGRIPRLPQEQSPLLNLGRIRGRTLYPKRAPAQLAGGRGFEPRHTDPESAVLPLDEPPGRSHSNMQA